MGQLCDDVFRPLETNESFSHLIPAPGRQQKIEVKVMVKDQGPGVPMALRPQLFRRFIPAGPGIDKAQYGLGLGLSVVKAIVEAQGGRVGVEDRPGGGAVFWFTLPVAGIRGFS